MRILRSSLLKVKKLESAYSYKTPEQFIREKDYKLTDELTNEQIYILGLEYIRDQIVTPDEKLLKNTINEYYNIINAEIPYKLRVKNFGPILTTYAKRSGSLKLKFLVDIWNKE